MCACRPHAKMFSINSFLYLFCLIPLLCLKIHGDKHYCDKDYNFNLTKIKDDPHPHYEDLVKIDERFAACGPNVLDIREITITQIQTLFSSRLLTSARLTTCYLKRIEQMNPYLNAIIETNPDAVRSALKSDYERFLGKKIYDHDELHGIPILLKDNIATKDSMQTCSGSLALVGYKPLEEATVVKSLRKASAVILGKTNLSEFANFRGTNIPNGWSSRGNQTHNCYFLHVDPYGSSTGSAVAVAANLGAIALGTETDGSIVAPSDSACLVGLKPSLGCFSSNGVIPIAPNSQDVVGPMTRTVADTITVYQAISQCGTQLNEEKSADMFTTEARYINTEGNANPQRIRCFTEPYFQSPRKFRIGILIDPFWIANTSDHLQLENVKILRYAIDKCEKSTNLKFIENISAPDNAFDETFRDAAIERELITLFHEFKTNVNDYLRNVEYDDNSNEISKSPGHLVHSEEEGPPTLKHVIEYNKKYPTLQGYNQEILERAEAIDGMANETYTDARTNNVNTIRKMLDDIFENYDLDAIAAPGISTGILKNIMYRYFAIAGYPYIIVPVECSKAKPVGIIFHGLMDSDSKLLTMAQEFENCVQGRQRPSFKR